jgi:glyoxylase-like metal-dependent hydrolase (beta-lactamase superfamily II)
MLRRSERVFPGVGLVEYRFSDYEVIDGIPFNRNFELYLNGDPNMQRTNVSTQVNVPLRDLVAADTTLVSIPEVTPDPLSRQEVADGVYLIGGSGTYAMFVDMGEYIVAVGGTAGIPERIDSLREVVADKPIKYAVMTHHHFDHVMGVSAYEAEGATLVAATAHEKIVRRAAEDGDSLSLYAVTGRKVLESDSRRIEIVDIGPTAHSDHLLIAYLEEEGLLFEADHFALPRVGPVPPAVSSTRSFAAALREHDIKVNSILSAHSARVGTMQDLHSALDKEKTLVSQK